MRVVLCAAAAGMALLTAAPGSANGRFPASNQFVFSPTDPNLIILRTTFGILVSHDGGTSWDFLCEDTLGLSSTAYEDPSLALTTNNSLVAGLSLGLNVSTDIGCSWNCVGGPLVGRRITDIAVRPDDPSSVVALTLTYIPSDAGPGSNFQQVFETKDNGSTWTALGVPIDSKMIVETIDVAKTDPDRIYVSGTRDYGMNRTASLLVSTDKGAHWIEHQIAQFDPIAEDSIFIGAIDPINADRVYVRSRGQNTGGHSRLLVTSDAALSFQVAETFGVAQGAWSPIGEIVGFAVSPDGAQVYAGTVEDGLWVASSSDMVFSKISSIHVRCLATRSHELWACSDSFVAGVSTNGGLKFTTKLAQVTGLAGIVSCSAQGPMACGANVAAAQCGMAFDNFCQLYSVRSDARCVPDLLDAGGTGASHASRSRGCSVGGSGEGAGISVCAGLAALALRRKRRTP